MSTGRHAEAGLRTELRDLKKLLRETRRTVAAPLPPGGFELRRDQWPDGDSWVRHEIYLAWVDRVPAIDRAERTPPAEYFLGDSLTGSLEQLSDGQLAKVLKSAVDVLTGRVKGLPGRRLHSLRTGNAATAADVVRGDGARCMRASIEQHTPAARRLHYWVLPGGAIELGRVVTHDDMEP